jgi:hypothetical protein
MVEAVIVLPVLALFLAAVPLQVERYAAHQHALLEARRCVWAYALSGCTEGPDDCDVAAHRDLPDESTLEPPADAGPNTDVVAQVRATRVTSGADVFDAVPLLGALLSSVLGDTAHARAEVLVREAEPRPRLAHSLKVACNERPRNVLAMARGVFCAHLPLLDCGGGHD